MNLLSKKSVTVPSDGFLDTKFILEINVVRKYRVIMKGWMEAPHTVLTEKRNQS